MKMNAALKERGFKYISSINRWRKANGDSYGANNVEVHIYALGGMSVYVIYIDEWAIAELKALFEAVKA